MENGSAYASASETADDDTRVHLPKLVSISYTAVYDNGAVSVGAVVADDSGEPLGVEFRNARGRATPLP